jgi:polyhydroxybutyrate depolymerase
MRYFFSIIVISSLLTCHSQTNSSINHDGIDRDFVYYTPSTWNISQELPLLIVLHGLTQTGSGVMGITDFNDIAETNNFIVCYPDGINNSWNANMNISVSSADDLGFIEELSTYFQNTLNTNPLKQYLCGFSSGSFMCHKIVCESSQCFAAIAAVSGNMSDTVDMNCSPNFKPSVLHIHGTADPVVNYFGSPTTGVAVDTTIEKWRMFLACDLTPVTTNMPNTNLFDFSYPQRIVYQNCGTSSLELIKIFGGGHQWPGILTLIGGLGNINMDFYSPQFIWDFLDGKSCPSTSGIVETDEFKLEISPNPVGTILSIKTNTPFESILIYDLRGSVLFDLNYYSNSFAVDVSSLRSGMYLLAIVKQNRIIQERFTKL